MGIADQAIACKLVSVMTMTKDLTQALHERIDFFIAYVGKLYQFKILQLLNAGWLKRAIVLCR